VKDRIQIEFVRGRACPDCGSALFHPGPRGGLAHNIKCADCGSTFWYSPPFKSERIDPVDGAYDLTVTQTLAEIEKSPPEETR